jgi:regulator of protease activity HflC (stomatin/prohibitin superfamily)
MDSNRTKSGLINLIVLVVVGVATAIVSYQARCLSGQLASLYLGLGVLVCAVSWFQMRLEVQEQLERMEWDELSKTSGSSTLFKTPADDSFAARRAREQFEKYFVPGFAMLLFLLQAGGAWALWRWLERAPGVPIVQPLVVLAFLGLAALVLFVLGKYASGLARLEGQRLLQPGASHLLLGAYLCATVVAAVVGVEAGFPKVDLILARALCLLLAVLAVETLISLVLEIYRPRIKGRVGPPLYESRLVGLLSRPEGILTTAAHALDYQFGFKVSETWFYRFMEKAIAWLVLAQLGILWLSSAFVFIEVGEEGLVERFGKPTGSGVLGPGFHLKCPWPIDQVYRFRTHEVQHFTVGFAHETAADDHGHKDGHGHGEGGGHEDLTLWTVSHTKEEFLLLVASREEPSASPAPPQPAESKKAPPVSLLAASIPVQYQIHDLRAWVYHHKDAAQLLTHLGSREVVRFLVSADLEETISRGRIPASEELRRRIQTRADELKLGVRILFVGLQDIHPPVGVAPSFEAVIGARQKREANLLNAAAYQVRTITSAGADALRLRREAEGERTRLETDTTARTALFTNQMVAFHTAPSVYALNAYLRTLTRGGQAARKYILATTNTSEIIQFNLEDKIREDLLNIPLPAPKAK